MFKFKMSLLLQNVKFRVAVIIMLITAIISGIIFIPKNKAGEPIQSIEIRSLITGVKVAGNNVTVIEKLGNVQGYDNLFCIEEDANLSYKVYSSPIDISNARDYFAEFNCARWIINNMYIANTTGLNGLSSEEAQSVMAMNLANLLTTDVVKNKVASYGFDVSDITPQKIYNIRKAQIGNTVRQNALETVEQIALWKYTKNVGTSVSGPYRNTMTQYFDGASLTDVQQKTLKYVYYAFTAIADMKAKTEIPENISNYITLNKQNAQFDENTYKVGPYYLESNGFKLTSFNFGDFENAEFPINITILKNDGTTVQTGKEIVEKNNDGSFYINLSGYKDQVKKVDFEISKVVSTVATKAYVFDGGDKQNLMGVDKSVGVTGLMDSKDIIVKTPEGKYSIVLKKVKEDGTTVISESPATFKINGNEQNTENGILNIITSEEIKDVNSIATYEIEETKAPQGYTLFNGKMKLNIKFKQVGKTFMIDRDNIQSEGFTNGAKLDISEDNTTITILVPNKELPKPGEYSVELYKIDDKGNTIETPAKFEINGQQKTTQNGKIQVASNIKVDDDKTVGTYKIKEIEAPENYYLFDGTISLNVKMTKIDNTYVLKQDGIDFSVDKENNGVKFSLEGSTIKIYVPNIPQKFDLSLRKFITQIDGTNVTPSREPIITLQSILNLQQTGTASYYHIKDSIGVNVGSEIEYTLRVYNEGDILGFAKQITDYLPEGLSFVRIADDSKKMYTTDSEIGSKTVVLNYNGNTKIKSLKDFYTLLNTTEILNNNKKINISNEYYQEVKIICKVEDTNSQYITNRSEITNYGYYEKDSQGNNVWKQAQQIGNVDIDSVQNTIKENLDLDNWYENAKERTYKDNKGNTVTDKNYYPGVQDDDDFETVVILNIEKEFDLSLRKFITHVNGKELAESREPKVDVTKLANGESTTATYTHSKEPVEVNTTDIVTYSIRVFNEGEADGYATKIMDDIPQGLEFLPESEINKQYKWIMYTEVKSEEDAIKTKSIKYNGKTYIITDKADEADLIVSDYLSLENGTNNLIKAFNSETKQLDYKDVKVEFKVIEPKTSDRIIINHAQITEHKDSDGKDVSDRDSIPNEWNEGEDDQDIDKVKVRYFDLALRKWVTKAIVTENGKTSVTETKHGPWDDPEPVVKVDLKNTNINNVGVKFEYTIRVMNQGQIPGYAKEVSDYIPEGLKFVAEDNKQWSEVDGKIITTALADTLLQPGEYADVTVILTWINGSNNLGLKINTAEISKDYNEWGTPDIDSTPNNKVPGEDDIDDAPVILTVKTGEPIVYTGIAIACIAIVSLGIVLIRKKVLDK